MSSDTPEKAYTWAENHYCEPDTRHLGYDPAHGFPKPAPQTPDTFCSYCLQWWPTHPEGSEHRPPEKGHTNG